MPIGATGIGSGLDIENLVSQLVFAEVAPASGRIAGREAAYQAQISALGSLKATLSTFEGSLSSVADLTTYQAKAVTSSAVSKISATATSEAQSGEYSLTVANLARAQSQVANATFSSNTTSIGSGTLTLTINSVSTDVEISSGQDSLEQVAAAINASGAKVNAVVINDGSDFRLALTATETGLSNVVSVSVDDDDNNDTDSSGLSRLASANLTETVAALDASLTINGLSLASSSNTLQDSITGVAITLNAVTEPNETVALSVSDNTAAIALAVNEFVTGFNDLWTTLKDLTSYDSDTGTSSVLTGDATVRSIETQIRSILNSPVQNALTTKELLAEIGVTTNSLTGLLEIDSAALNDSIANNLDDLAAIFSDYAISTSSNITYRGATTETDPGTYAVAGSLTSSTSGELLFTTAVPDFSYNGNGNDANFDISVDGGVAQSVSLSSNLGDLASLVAELNSQIAGATVTANSSNGLTFTSDTTGTSSSVQITNADTNATSGLGISNTTGTTGTAVYGYSLDGVAATLNTSTGYYSGISLTPSEGLVFEIGENAVGAVGSLTFSKGIASSLTAYIDSILSSDGTLESKISGLQDSVTDLVSQQEALDLRALSLEARYRRQFNALDGLIAQLNTTQSFLSSALSGFVEPNTTLKK